MRVLVVEDEELIVEFLKRSLKIEKHDVDVASVDDLARVKW